MKAFPNNRSEGMTLRDYFAAKSIQTAFAMIKNDLDRELPQGYNWSDAEDYEDIAARAYEMADAMMKARNGNTGK